jgi:hypothetical protein
MVCLLQTLDRVCNLLLAQGGDVSVAVTTALTIPQILIKHSQDFADLPSIGKQVFRFEISNRRYETVMHLRNVNMKGSDAHADDFDCLLFVFNETDDLPPRMMMCTDRLYFSRMIIKEVRKTEPGKSPEIITWKEFYDVLKARFKPKLNHPASAPFSDAGIQRLEGFTLDGNLGCATIHFLLLPRSLIRLDIHFEICQP